MASLMLATKSSQAAAHVGAWRVERTGIKFANTGFERVDIRMVVTNVTDDVSPPTEAIVSAATLGAFVPWRPLATVAVPPLRPHESFVVRAVARPPRRVPLGTPDRVSPRQLLTALAADDGGRQRRQASRHALGGLMSFLKDRRGIGLQGDDALAAELPADPLELLWRDKPHWAGNLNIFIGGRSVERHMAQALRIYPERANLAFFVVGTQPDAYAFQLKGTGAHWSTALFDLTHGNAIVPQGDEAAIVADQWVEANPQALMILAIQPAADCGAGRVEVHVTQRSTGETAVVEFSLDPSAVGPGCYVV